MDGMALEDYEKHCDTNRTTVKEMLELAKSYNKVITYFIVKKTVIYTLLNVLHVIIKGFGRRG